MRLIVFATLLLIVLCLTTSIRGEKNLAAKLFPTVEQSECGGILNIEGEPGEEGPQGDRGPRGKRGIQGPPGPRGPRGEKGAPGLQGVMGIPGEIGDAGLVGLIGAKGPRGDRGPQGIRGEKGFKGIKGIKGIRGIRGLPGDQGPPGPRGPRGAPGKPGIRGLQGVQGLQGLQGVQGVRGDKGLPGIQGLQGIQGIQGLKGFKGLQGIQGVRGKKGAQGDAGDSGMCLACSYGKPDCFTEMRSVEADQDGLMCPTGYYLAGFSLHFDKDKALMESKDYIPQSTISAKDFAQAQKKAAQSSEKFVWTVTQRHEYSIFYRIQCCALTVATPDEWKDTALKHSQVEYKSLMEKAKTDMTQAKQSLAAQQS